MNDNKIDKDHGPHGLATLGYFYLCCPPYQRKVEKGPDNRMSIAQYRAFHKDQVWIFPKIYNSPTKRLVLLYNHPSLSASIFCATRLIAMTKKLLHDADSDNVEVLEIHSQLGKSETWLVEFRAEGGIMGDAQRRQ